MFTDSVSLTKNLIDPRRFLLRNNIKLNLPFEIIYKFQIILKFLWAKTHWLRKDTIVQERIYMSKKSETANSKDLKMAKSQGPLQSLLELSDKIEPEFDLESFPLLARRILEDLNFEMSFEEFEQAVADWLLELDALPPQVNLYNVFGEPSISLFNNGKFSVDVYFWRKNDTLIHSHGFRGAFKVLYGNSLHEEFKIETTDDLGRKSLAGSKIVSDVLSSKVNRFNYEILKKGNTRTIKPAMGLVHRILHLNDPTVTLCIRTVNDKELSQWHHLSSGISYRQSDVDELTIKRILYFQFLFESNPEFAKNYLSHMLSLISVASQLALYEGLYNDEFGLAPETTYFMVDQMRLKFQDLKWFMQYEDHYRKANMDLFETEASSGPLKLLAHTINNDYTPSEVADLVWELGEKFNLSEDMKSGYMIENLFEVKGGSRYKDLKSLAQLLFNDDSVFSEEHYDYQQNRIIEFGKEIIKQEKLNLNK